MKTEIGRQRGWLEPPRASGLLGRPLAGGSAALPPVQPRRLAAHEGRRVKAGEQIVRFLIEICFARIESVGEAMLVLPPSAVLHHQRPRPEAAQREMQPLW